MKRLISIISAAVISFSAASVIDLPTAANAAQYSADGVTLTYTTEASAVIITGCTKAAATLSIPDTIDGIPVASIEKNAFADCAALTEINIPDSVQTVKEKAFWNCGSLKRVTIGSGTEEIGDYAFSACLKLASFDVSGENAVFSDISGMLFSKDGTELICYAGPASAVIPDSAEVIGKAAFFGNSAVKNVTFNSKLKSIGDYSFSGCFGLEAVKLPLGVKSLGKGSFMNCSSLKQAILGSGLTSIPEECFSMCTVLSTVNIGPAISEIGSGAFFSCYKLSGIELPATVKKIGADAAGTHHNILSGENTAVHGFYISGEEGSAAEKYARSSGVDFIDFAAVPYGDVDGDGSVDASDASSVLREYALTSTGNPPTFTFYQKLTGDFDCDGAVNSLDASRILAYYAENATQH